MHIANNNSSSTSSSIGHHVDSFNGFSPQSPRNRPASQDNQMMDPIIMQHHDESLVVPEEPRRREANLLSIEDLRSEVNLR
jgi:hypothetical protein